MTAGTDNQQQQQQQQVEPDDANVDESFHETTLHCQDILIELFWYIKWKRNDKDEQDFRLCFQDIVWALEKEGIYFWKDYRYIKSQIVTLHWIDAGGDDTVNNDESMLNQKVATEIQDQIGRLTISYKQFVEVVTPCARLFLNAFNEGNIIPDWSSFSSDLHHFYKQSSKDNSGQTAQYIPVLRDANPNYWSVSVCSVDGQRVSFGDSAQEFSLQSVSKPVTYAIGLTKEGEEFMEQWIDVEPAGRPFNTQDLDPTTQRPFNASLNSGAIMAAGIVGSGYPKDISWRSIVDDIRTKWTELCGYDIDVGFSEETYESEKASAYNNFAIAYNLKGRRGLPRDVDLHKMLDIYLGCCSIEISTEALSVVAATLANGGICPITEKEVFPAQVVRTVLAETMTCGLYDQAGHFAVQVGLPAKSGVSGALMVMVPGVFGFATFSPKLNAKGNSVKGIDFCKRLVDCYRLHVFETSRGNNGVKIDPRQNGWKDEQKKISHLAWAASVGDDNAIRLRDIFLYSLCLTAAASKEGLSEREISIIREKYKQIFLVDLDPSLFQTIIDNTRKTAKGLEHLESLVNDTYVTGAMKEVIFSAMIDIAMPDGVIEENSRDVAIRIAQLALGINEAVAKLELRRHQKNVGHRFEKTDVPDMIENVNAAVIRPSAWNSKSCRSLESKIDDESYEEEDDTTGFHYIKEEALLLRKNIARLGQRLAALTKKNNVQKKGLK